MIRIISALPLPAKYVNLISGSRSTDIINSRKDKTRRVIEKKTFKLSRVRRTNTSRCRPIHCIANLKY